MPKRKSKAILDMFGKKQMRLMREQEDIREPPVLSKKIGKNSSTNYILMMKNSGLFVKYAKNFLVIMKMLYRNRKVFLYVFHLQIIENYL